MKTHLINREVAHVRRGWEKLKSRSGATILFAILVFMLCILAGTAALTAAAANSGRYTHLRAEQQKYLTVSSAAKLLEKQVVEKELVVVKTTPSSGTETYEFSGSIVESSPGTINAFYNIIENAIEKAAKGTGTGTGLAGDDTAIKLNISDSTGGTDSKFDVVTAELEIDTSYNMTFTVYVAREVSGAGGSTTEKDYVMVVKVPATKATSEPVTDAAGETTTTYTISWLPDSASITYGG